MAVEYLDNKTRQVYRPPDLQPDTMIKYGVQRLNSAKATMQRLRTSAKPSSVSVLLQPTQQSKQGFADRKRQMVQNRRRQKSKPLKSTSMSRKAIPRPQSAAIRNVPTSDMQNSVAVIDVCPDIPKQTRAKSKIQKVNWCFIYTLFHYI